jgi:hypothetical protein
MLKNGIKYFFKNYSKLSIISISLYLFHNFQNKKLFCKQHPNSFYTNSLLSYNQQTFSRRLCPKILFLTTNTEGDTEQDDIRDSFQKVYQKYNDLESYYLDISKVESIDDLTKLFKQYGYSLEDFIKDYDVETSKLNDIVDTLVKKPFFLLNKYGDIKNYSIDEFREMSKSENVSTYFEKLTLLTNKSDILLMNDNDYMFLIYRKANVGYNDNAFKIFRKIYFNLSFFNIKFFVATPENTPFLNNLEENNIYLLKRENLLTPGSNQFKFEGENFELFNLTNNLSDLGKANDGKLLYNYRYIFIKTYENTY